MAAPLGRQVFTLGREALHGYWRGYYGYIAAIKTLAPFNEIRDSVPQEMQEIDRALRDGLNNRPAIRVESAQFSDDGIAREIADNPIGFCRFAGHLAPF